ncbi:MAG: hypothetical protein K5666_01435 [Bacilli bacterium]|nr:hypothetical protein [Bacilli bacterium]
MRKNGYVFMETVVVICVLSITLLVLYASYAHILRMTKEKTTFDTTDSIYATYYVKKVLDFNNSGNTSFEQFFPSHSSYCSTINDGTGYVCNIGSIPESDVNFYQLKNIFDVDKIYYLSPAYILNNSKKADYLMELDATTIDYVKSLGVGVTDKVLIVKYKHVYSDNRYEVIHASLEV